MKVNLTQGLDRACQIRGDEAGIIDGQTTLSWNELKDRIARLAAGFRSLGLQEGDRVALLSLNSHHSVECFFAAIWAGGVITPLNFRLSVSELKNLVTDVSPKILVAGSDFIEIAQSLDIPQIIYSGNDDMTPEECQTYEELINQNEPMEKIDRSGDDLACLFFTGGTTGTPKGVMLSHSNIMANTLNFIGNIGMNEHTVHLHCGPLFHVASAVRLFSVTQAAGTHVMLPKFNNKDVLSAITKHKVTLATFVPTMLKDLIDLVTSRHTDLSSLRHITYGAAPMPEELLRKAMETMPQVQFVQSYGMTELSPIATMLSAKEHAEPSGAKLKSAGRPALLSEVRIVNDNGDTLPAGEIGEVTVKGPMVMLGYWQKPDETAKVLKKGWMHTGDLGYLDEEGYLFVVDRLKDVIISGGENIYSQEVENVLHRHPSVNDCAVLGLPDEKWGEQVYAVVVPNCGAAIDANALIEHCRLHLAGYKCPKSIEIRTTPLPRSGTNKVLKPQLKEEALATAR